MSDAQGNLTHNTEAVTNNSNIIFEQKLLSYRNIPVLPLPTNQGIDQRIEDIRLAPKMLLIPATKEIVADAAPGGACIHSNPRQLIRTGVDGFTPGNIGNDIDIVKPSSPVLIGMIGTAPPCGLNLSQEVGDKRKSTPSGLVRK